MFRLWLVFIIALMFFCPINPLANESERSPGWLRQQQEYREETRGAKRITAFGAYAMYKAGTAFLISVDPPEYYKRRHILGSINIPSDKFEKGRLKLSKNQIIILYCR